MFPFTSSNITITQTQGRDPSARLNRRTTTSVKIIGAAAIALLASAHSFANAAENSTRMAREHHACAVVMGLHQPGDLYDTCIRSLNKTLSGLDRGPTGIDTPKQMCPGGAQARYAGFRTLRGRRRTIPSGCGPP
jgi:hypothetical protein